MWTEEWAGLSLSNALVRHRASHRVSVTRTVVHTFSAIPRWVMWAVEWAGLSLSNADLRHLTSHGVDVTRARSHSCSAVRGWVGWADEWTGFSRCPIYHNTGHGPLTAHCIDGSSTVGQYGSTVRVFDMWTEERAGVTLTNADLRHRASHGVGLARTASHTFSAVHRWQGWTRCWHCQSGGEEIEEQERHLEAHSDRQFCLPRPPGPRLYPHTTCDLFAPFLVTELSLI